MDNPSCPLISMEVSVYAWSINGDLWISMECGDPLMSMDINGYIWKCMYTRWCFLKFGKLWCQVVCQFGVSLMSVWGKCGVSLESVWGSFGVRSVRVSSSQFGLHMVIACMSKDAVNECCSG